MSKALIYLSGGMEKAVDLGAKWREVCSAELEKRGYSAIDITALDVAYTKIHGHVYMDTSGANQLQNKSNIRHQFIYTDMRLIKDDADAVIAYYDEAFKNGAGSFAECQCTYDVGKPLFIVAALPHVPTWLRALGTKMFATFDELYAYLDTLPDGVLKVDRYGNHGKHSSYLCSLCGEVFAKSKHHFVSKISPLYCRTCVDLVKTTREEHADRYEFCSLALAEQEANFDKKNQ